MKKFDFSISNENGFNGPGLTEEDYWFGGNTKLVAGKERRRDRNWRGDAPTEEPQVKKRLDTYGCLNYSGQNVIEIDLIAQVRDGNDGLAKVLDFLKVRDENFKPDFSEDFNVLLSGTIPHVGNSQGNVSESYRRDGLIAGDKLVFTDEMTQEVYFNMDRITPELKTLGQKTKEYIKIGWERIPYVAGRPYAKPEDLYEALGYFPMQVIVAPASNVRNGIIMPLASYNYNHAQGLVKAVWKKSFTVVDSYQNSRGDIESFYKTYDWNYPFGWPLRYQPIMLKGVLDPIEFLAENEGKFVQGTSRAIYKIENGKKRPFAYWPDYVLFDGAKGVARPVSDEMLALIKDGPTMDPKESPNWKFVSEKYELIRQMSAPDNIKRLTQLVQEGQRAEGSIWTTTANVVLSPSIKTGGVSLLRGLIDFIQSLLK